MGILLSEIRRKYGSGGNKKQEERALDRPVRRLRASYDGPGVSSWDAELNAAKDVALKALSASTFFLPDGSTGLVGGIGAEIVGNALQTLGDPEKTLRQDTIPP